jgi:hypothetical protein
MDGSRSNIDVFAVYSCTSKNKRSPWNSMSDVEKDHLQTHFLSASFCPTRTATRFNVSFSTSLEILGKLGYHHVSIKLVFEGKIPTYRFFSTSTKPVLVKSLPSTASLNSVSWSDGNSFLVFPDRRDSALPLGGTKGD